MNQTTTKQNSRVSWLKIFRFQLALAFAFIICIAIVTLTSRAADRESTALAQALNEQSIALADNLANASSAFLLVRDYTSLENLLLGTVKFPGLISIEVADGKGYLVGEVRRNEKGQYEARYGSPRLSVPTTSLQTTNQQNSQIIIWKSIVLSDVIGWVRVSYSLEPIKQAKKEIWRNNTTEGAIIVVISFFLVAIVLRRPTLTLSRYTDFADQLDELKCKEIKIDNSSYELRRLGIALNQTSLKLSQQRDNINQMLMNLERVAAMAEHSPNVVFSIEQKDQVVYSNRRANELAAQFDLNPDQLTRILPENFEQIRKLCLSKGEAMQEIESSYQDKTFLWSFSPLKEHGVVHCHGMDISDRKKAQQALIHQANYDFLTDLPNRALALDRLEQAIIRANREQKHVGVLFLDLDRFKTVNDTLGHLVGDQLLLQVTQRLLQHVREGDTVARLGGDEFIIILDTLEHAIDPEHVAEKILQAMTVPFMLNNNELFISTSIGIAVYPEDGNEPQVLLRNADAALYRAKDSGRNNFVFFTQALNNEAQNRLKMETSLRSAIKNKEFRLNYQPQIDSKTGSIIGVEALIRWKNPKLGYISPADFIPLAEDTGLIVEIGEWVLNTACKDLTGWQGLTAQPLRMAVNVSSRQFRSDTLTNIVLRALQKNNIQTGQLELEITESLLLRDSPDLVEMLDAIKALGITLSLDDFGTGYSSLSYLKRFPFDSLKIDRTFVSGITTNPEDAALCEAIIAIAKTLGLNVIAEGVETTEQIKFLTKHGADAMQGFYYGKPMNASHFHQFLLNYRPEAFFLKL